jgi:hypothetical protein
MIWLAWRQMRAPALIVAGLLVALSVVLALSGSHLVHLYDTVVVPCQRRNDCASVTHNFESQAKWNHVWDILVIVTPALVGIFWGAPLVAREFETRTNRLAWTQSVTRTRWFIVKVTLVGAVALATTGLVSLMVTWWATPSDRLRNDPFNFFDKRDIVPVAYALFAFALGVAMGVVIRRTVPAMAATLATFVVVRIAVGQWLRPRLFAPLHMVTAFSVPVGPGAALAPTGNRPGIASINPADLIVSQQTLDRAGRVIGQDGGIGSNGTIDFSTAAGGRTVFQGVGPCPNKFPPTPANRNVTPAINEAMQRCIGSFHLRTAVAYQPVSRYWPLQWAEVGVFVVLAVLLLGGAFWWLRHKLA